MSFMIDMMSLGGFFIKAVEDVALKTLSLSLVWIC